jgi:RHS repeat-associated protein
VSPQAVGTAPSGLPDARGQTTRYEYDARGRRTRTVFPDGTSEATAYDALGRLASQTPDPSAGEPAVSYTYTAAGLRASMTDATGTTAYTYDDRDRLLTKQTPQGTLTYTYDAAGRLLTARSSNVEGVSVAYAYDAAGRLSSVTDRRLGGTTAYDYDPAGNLEGTTYPNQVRTSYSYDGDGNRVSKTEGGVTTRYLVDTNNPTGHAQVVEESVGGAVVRRYTYGLDLISQRQLVGGAWGTSFYGYDGHGSVRYLTDSSGAVTDTYDYDAFGNLVARTGSTPNDYLFAGEQFDPNVGLYYLRARYLNPAAGRFQTADTYEGVRNDPPSLHRYLYANADPVNKLDPSGKFTVIELEAAQTVRATLAETQSDIGFAIFDQLSGSRDDEDGLGNGIKSLFFGSAFRGFFAGLQIIGGVGARIASRSARAATRPLSTATRT